MCWWLKSWLHVVRSAVCKGIEKKVETLSWKGEGGSMLKWGKRKNWNIIQYLFCLFKCKEALILMNYVENLFQDHK